MSSTLKRKGRQKGKWRGLYSNEEELKELQRQHGKETSKKWAKEWAKMRMSRPPTEKEIAIRKKLAERMRKFNKDPKMRKKQVAGWINNPSEKMLETWKRKSIIMSEMGRNRSPEMKKQVAIAVSRTNKTRVKKTTVNLVLKEIGSEYRINSAVSTRDFVILIRASDPQITLESVVLAYANAPSMESFGRQEKARKIAELKNKLYQHWYEINPPQ